MTSWEQGKEKEVEGQVEKKVGEVRGDTGQEVRGGLKETGGKIEQGLDNIKDTVTGRQEDMEGNVRTDRP
ncbi:MAG: hypothetical protein ACR2M0_00720 [Chloroflexia bacterium]